MMDVKTLSGANCTARDRTRGLSGAERRWRSARAGLNVDYIARARTLDHAHSRQADGTPYPVVRDQVREHLVGPVLAALQNWDLVIGLVAVR